jgi:hypothetical protein
MITSANMLVEQNTTEQQPHLIHPEPKTQIFRAIRAPETTIPASQLASGLNGPHHVELTLLQRQSRVKKQLNRLQAQQSSSSCAVSSSVTKDRHAKCESVDEENESGEDSLVMKKHALESGK